MQGISSLAMELLAFIEAPVSMALLLLYKLAKFLSLFTVFCLCMGEKQFHAVCDIQ
jgi:hypothetical protein